MSALTKGVKCPHYGHQVPTLWASNAHTKGHLCPMQGALRNIVREHDEHHQMTFPDFHRHFLFL